MPKNAHNEALLQAVFDAAVDAIVVSDAQGRITGANKAALLLFGYEEDELISQSVNMLMPHALASQHDSFMNNYMRTGEKKIIDIGREVAGLRKDGTEFPLHLSVGTGSVQGEPIFVGILHDLRAAKAAEEALSRSQRLDAIGQMTGGIAHDFNNLLTVVIGNLELLEMRIENEQERALLTDAIEASELGADLTSKLMLFASKSVLTPEPLDLAATCESLLSLLRRTLGAHITIETRFGDDDIPRVSVDPTQFQSAIVNLAINARDAMPDGGKLLFEVSRIEIDDTYIAQETNITLGSYVRLSISDSGEGMSDEAQGRAFEPFFTTKPSGKGTGLGLSMVYGFMRQSGGHVTLYSELGKGTTFCLYFPSPEGAVVTDRTGKDGIHLQRGNGECVLVVEDDAKVRRLSVERLRNLGFETREAETGDEALSTISDGGFRPDLVFSDVVMPGALSGFDLAMALRKEYPDLKILLTTGYADEMARNNVSEEVATFPILRKPYRLADLAKHMDEILGLG